MDIFVMSDTHFGHNREFIYKPRGFTSIEAHDEALIENWNSIIKPQDTVYHLGDVMLNDNAHGLECLKRLNGNINLLLGNHDTTARIKLYLELENVTIYQYATMLKWNKYHFYLSHYPTYTGNLEDNASLHCRVLGLHGHTHQFSKFYQDIPFMYNCSPEAHNCKPVAMEEIINDIKNKVNECYAQL